MKRVIAMVAVVATAGVLAAAPPAPSPAQVDAGKRAFGDVVRVLQSPRCMNCHPSGDRPLQSDRSLPHAQNVSRLTIAAGVPCATCHQERNSEVVGVAGGPPGAPHWGLPPVDQPMVFQGKTATQLCEQVKDPKQNHGRSLAALVEHVEHDPLVLWGWSPGGQRTTPPISHDVFVAAFKTWVDGGAACP